MQQLFILAFAANVALTLISSALLPARVACHFGAGGRANGWSSNTANTLMMLGVEIVLFSMIYWAPRLALAFPYRWISLPNKDFWLSPANRPRALEKLQNFQLALGSAIFLFLFVISALTLQANRSQPVCLNLAVFFTAFGALILFTAACLIGFYRAFRVPDGPRQAGWANPAAQGKHG